MTLRTRRQIWRGELEMRSPLISSGFRNFVFRICHNSPTFQLRGDWCLHDPLRAEIEERFDGFFFDIVCWIGTGAELVTGVQHPHMPSFKLLPHTWHNPRQFSLHKDWRGVARMTCSRIAGRRSISFPVIGYTSSSVAFSSTDLSRPFAPLPLSLCGTITLTAFTVFLNSTSHEGIVYNVYV